jgi:hypothetical protein
MPEHASPQPSPEAPTSSLHSPPPVRKPSAARCLCELQNQASPTKPSKLLRTESGLPMPAVFLSQSADIVPVDLNSCLTDALPFDSVIQDLEAVLDQYEPDDPKGKRPMHTQPEDPVANDTEEEALDGEPKDKTTMDIEANANDNDANDAKPAPSAPKRTLLSTMRKKGEKGVTGSSSAYNSARLAAILDTPATSRKVAFDPRVSPEANIFDIAYGLYETDA